MADILTEKSPTDGLPTEVSALGSNHVFAHGKDFSIDL
jgi:hypothetical protein